MEKFSERLKSLRKSSQATQKQVALEIGISERSYQRFEAGEKPSVDTLITLADYFNVSLDYLVGRSDNPENL